MKLSLKTRVADDITVIVCIGRIAYGVEVDLLSEKMDGLLPHTRHLVIDLSAVEMIDAAGLGKLVSVAVTAQTSDCAIKLAAPSDFICQLLELTNLTSVFEAYSTVDAAKLAFSEQVSIASAGL